MSVVAGQRKQGKLDVLTKALRVANYTNQILANQNKFDPKYDHVLGDDIKQTARNIYKRCWSANNIRVSNTETFKARAELQQRAVQDCNELLILIDMAYGTYHLPAKRVEFWGRITIEARDLIKKWRAADLARNKRYDVP